MTKKDWKQEIIEKIGWTDDSPFKTGKLVDALILAEEHFQKKHNESILLMKKELDEKLPKELNKKVINPMEDEISRLKAELKGAHEDKEDAERYMGIMEKEKQAILERIETIDKGCQGHVDVNTKFHLRVMKMVEELKSQLQGAKDADEKP